MVIEKRCARCCATTDNISVFDLSPLCERCEDEQINSCENQRVSMKCAQICAI